MDLRTDSLIVPFGCLDENLAEDELAFERWSD